MNKKLQKQIDNRNKVFRAATRAEKRVLIAKDVIKQIKLGRIVPMKGAWVETLRYYFSSENKNQSLQQEVLNNTATCNCCGVGSLLLSCTLFKNRVTIGDVQDCDQLSYSHIINNEIIDKVGIRKIFSVKQLKLIEIAFEYGWGFYREPEHKAAYMYRGLDSHDRLIAIMQNIIDNKGTFKVS